MQDYLFPSEVKLRQAQVPGSIHVFSDGFRLVNDDVLVPTETTAYPAAVRPVRGPAEAELFLLRSRSSVAVPLSARGGPARRVARPRHVRGGPPRGPAGGHGGGDGGGQCRACRGAPCVDGARLRGAPRPAREDHGAGLHNGVRG